MANPELQRCDVCNKIDLDNVSQYEHHKSWAELKSSAVAGCQLCKLFYFVKLETDKQSKKPHGVSQIGQLYLSRSSSTLTFGTNFMNIIRFRICTGKGMYSWSVGNSLPRSQELLFIELMFLDWPPNDNNYDRDTALPIRLVEDDPASEVAFARAQSWIEYCKANHPHCLPNEDVHCPLEYWIFTVLLALKL